MAEYYPTPRQPVAGSMVRIAPTAPVPDNPLLTAAELRDEHDRVVTPADVERMMDAFFPSSPAEPAPLPSPGDELAINFDADEGHLHVVSPSGNWCRLVLRGRFPYSLAEFFEDVIRRSWPDRTPQQSFRAMTLRWVNLAPAQQIDNIATRAILRRAGTGQ